MEEKALNACIQSLDFVDADPKFACIDNPSRGKCYVASIALLQFLGGKDAGYSLKTAKDECGVPHYWVENISGDVLDPTAEQYTVLGIKPPYEQGDPIGYRGNIKKHLPLLEEIRRICS